MVLDEQDLREGLKFIVGTWQVDFVVNAFSNDLAHIPAAEFKSEDGGDFSAITFTFSEDHTVVMEDTVRGKKESGAWEQTGWGEYHYTLGAFLDLPDDTFRKNAETISVQDGCLVFGLGFLAIGMKKIAEGTVTETKEPDIGEIEPSAEDAALCGIVGVWKVAAAMTVIGGDFRLCTREEVEADLDARGADEEERREELKPFDPVIEFTADHRVLTRMKLPEGVSEEEIRAALEAGEISDLRDGMFSVGEKEWKAVGGRYYYNTGEHREIFGEVKSPWDELAVDEEGLLPFASSMMKLKRV